MKIYVYQNGSAIMVDPSSPDQASINGEEPVQILEATDENIQTYFGDITPPTIKI